MQSSTVSPEVEATIRSVADVFDAEDMRLVRNEVSQYMTHNTLRISRQDQVAWFREVYQKNQQGPDMLRGFVMHAGQEPVGYGLVSCRNGKYWVSGGLIEAVRGKGYGRALFRYLTNFILNELQDTPYLDVRADNAPARTLYESLGYKAVSETPDLIVMVYSGGPQC